MIELNEIFLDDDKRIAFMCDSVKDTNDLAPFAEVVIKNSVKLISVLPEEVAFLWTCLERENVDILTRYSFSATLKNIDKNMSDLSANIVNTFKKGANGVQIFLKMRDLEKFTDAMSPIRDDLFFGHSLNIVIDILDIDFDKWDFVFEKLKALKVSAFGLTLSEDTGKQSDYIGRIYGMLENWNFDGDLHFMLSNNVERIDQTIRLIEKIKPELSNRVKFFLEY